MPRFAAAKLDKAQRRNWVFYEAILIDERRARIREGDPIARAAKAESGRLKVDGSETQKITCIRLPDHIWVARDEPSVPLPVESILTP
jgi:hypothetical protein